MSGAVIVERNCCVRGYHVYKDFWKAVINEELDSHRHTFLYSLVELGKVYDSGL